MNMLPEDLRDSYTEYFIPDESPETLKLVKAADKISALIKCIEEEKAGNREFVSAKISTEKAIKELNCPEADIFCEEFIDAYGLTLDEL